MLENYKFSTKLWLRLMGSVQESYSRVLNSA